MSEEHSYSNSSSDYQPKEEDEEESAESSESSWVQWYCGLEGHDFLVEVAEEFLRDASNLYGLKSKVPNFNEALYHILTSGEPEEEDLQNEQYLELYQSCSDLYGLAHARFIQTPLGLTVVREKYLAGKYGVCPRVLCERHNVLPVGMSNELRTSRAKVYCPRCQDVYYPKDKAIELDGAYFGTSIPHVLLQHFPFLYPLQEHKEYVPKIAGFKVHNKRGAYAEAIETKYRTDI
jgi:casein kinase II subunit beta